MKTTINELSKNGKENAYIPHARFEWYNGTTEDVVFLIKPEYNNPKVWFLYEVYSIKKNEWLDAGFFSQEFLFEEEDTAFEDFDEALKEFEGEDIFYYEKEDEDEN